MIKEDSDKKKEKEESDKEVEITSRICNQLVLILYLNWVNKCVRKYIKEIVILKSLL